MSSGGRQSVNGAEVESEEFDVSWRDDLKNVVMRRITAVRRRSSMLVKMNERFSFVDSSLVGSSFVVGSSGSAKNDA